VAVPTDDEGLLRVNRSCAIPLRELTWKFTASGGPGGQHANTANTKVDLRFDIEESESLGPRQKTRLLEKLGPSVRITSSERRSQLQNRELALERLRTILQEALAIERPRVATKPSRNAKVKRVESKRRRSEVKRGRQRPGDDS
jgi:ribosome-associated protein